LTFSGTVSLNRGPRSFLVCALKVPAPDERDSLVLGVYVTPEKASSITSACPVPAWMVSIVSDQSAANMIVNQRLTKLELPSHLCIPSASTITIQVTYLSPSTPVSAEDSGPTQLTRVELGGEVQAKRRQSRCANQPPSEVSSVFGASAASASMAKRAAASAQSGAAPGSGGPSAAVRGAKKDKLFQHLLN
ncbi:unnamed protein product, partial [Prorocentrum cordatum]